MKRVLLLGAGGMLGSMMNIVLRESGFEVLATQRRDRNRPAFLDARDSVNEIGMAIERCGQPAAIVNCIGIIRVDPSSPKSIEEALVVNGVFPWKLGFAAVASNIPVIHISTDGVFRGRARPYLETSRCDAVDVYGLSKRVGEATYPTMLGVRCSIIGPDTRGQGLLEWFLSHSDGSEVPGFTNHVWNGVTTRQLSAFIAALLKNGTFQVLRARTAVVHFSPNLSLSKYQLLREINKAYSRQIRVRPVEARFALTRILRTRYAHICPIPSCALPIAHALRELAGKIANQKRSHE